MTISIGLLIIANIIAIITTIVINITKLPTPTLSPARLLVMLCAKRVGVRLIANAEPLC